MSRSYRFPRKRLIAVSVPTRRRAQLEFGGLAQALSRAVGLAALGCFAGGDGLLVRPVEPDVEFEEAGVGCGLAAHRLGEPLDGGVLAGLHGPVAGHFEREAWVVHVEAMDYGPGTDVAGASGVAPVTGHVSAAAEQ